MATVELYRTALFSGLRPDPDLKVWQWADEYREMPQSYAEAGRYRTSRTPYLREPMENLSPSDPCQEMCSMKGTQLGWTEAGNNWFLFSVDLNPGPCMMVLPTVDLAKKHSKKKLMPSIRASKKIAHKFKDNKSRDSGNTLFLKEYVGGSIALAGSNSAASFRSDTVRDLFLDDVDGYPPDVDGEGDPCDLAENRTDAVSNRKIWKNSTPTVKGASRIDTEFEDSDQRLYEVPCPHCQQKQALEWGGKDAKFGIKFTRNDKGHVTDAWYQCLHCGGRIDEHWKTWMMAEENGAEWVPQNPGHPKKGYRLPSYYSPLGWLSWKKIVKEFLAAIGNPIRMKRWVNTRDARAYETKGTQPEWKLIKNRAEPYEQFTVPPRGLLLTMGVDVQGDRLSCSVYAFGRHEESWLVARAIIFEDPAQAEAWKQLDSLIARPFRHTSGVDLLIASVGIDSGGHHTQEVYSYCRTRGPRVFALKGQSQRGKPIIGRATWQDINYRGEHVKHGVQLWPVGSDTAKEQIYARLQIEEHAEGKPYIHFPQGLPDDFYRELTAEKLITRYHKGFPVEEWVIANPGQRNEALDECVYALAAAHRVGLPVINWDAWENQMFGGGGQEPAPRKKSNNNAKSKRGSRW